MAASLAGQTLGKYRILEPLGSGGMARVYRAYHPQLDRFVAVKVLRSDLVDNEAFLARFQREAQAIATLRHPHIIQVHDFDVQDDHYFMVMELLDGDTLHARLTDYRIRDEQMPWGEMARILLDVLGGLAFAHEAGMVHRDIKPANILLTRQGQAVLADFGIAQIVGGTHHTVSGALLGTLNYMAPEQGLQGISDVRSDLYSLGVVFFEMLTRQPPYEADTPLAILLKHVNDPLPLPRSLNSDIPLPFEKVVLKALAKEPDDRFQTAREMETAVRAALAAASISLPERISLPLSFTTTDAPAESVSIYSGTARGRLQEAAFAAQDTSATPATDWTAQLAALKAEEKDTAVEPEKLALPPNPGRFLPALPRFLSRWLPAGLVARTKRLWAKVGFDVPDASVDRAVINAIGMVVAGNMLVVMLSGISGGPAEFFRVGWPVELFFVGGALLHVMAATRNIWLLIPAGIFTGHAFLMSYYAITGNWQQWAFLWPLVVVIIMVSIIYPVNVATNPQRAQALSLYWGRRLGRAVLLGALALTLFALVQ